MTKSVKSHIFFGVIAFALFCGSECYAQTPNPKQYFEISPPMQMSPTDKIEVAEVFSYGCIHCAHFQPLVDAWRKRMDTKKVEFVYLPATFNPLFALLARGYYAADSLGVVEKTHQGVFNAIHQQNLAIRSFDDIVDLYAKLGVSREDFTKAAHSFLIQTELRRGDEFMNRYRIDGTPTLIVAGKYRISADSAGSQENMFRIADQLIAQELAQRGTSRQAPSSGK